MALNFEYQKQIMYGSTPFISHEPDSTIYHFVIDSGFERDYHGVSNKGLYDYVALDKAARSVTVQPVEKIGVKNFPGVGSVAFYKTKYTYESRVVIPVFPKEARPSAPEFSSVTISNGRVRIVISDSGEQYPCYRVVLRNGYFAEEYISYDKKFEAPIPPVIGSYMAYVTGYNEDNGISSNESEGIYAFYVSDGVDSWAPISDIETRLTNVENSIGDIGTVLDEINGEEV